MARKKKIRAKGRLQLSRYFQEIGKEDMVAVVKEPSLKAEFPNRIQGRTGIVEGKRGKSYIIKIKDFNKEKRFIIKPIHLKKILTQHKK